MRRKHGEKTKKKQWTQGGANLGGEQREIVRDETWSSSIVNGRV